MSCSIGILKSLYAQLPKTARIAHACVTGYGEHLIRAALDVDEGEIETMTHFRAAAHFRPDVDFIIDIGGQDMKCMRVRNGIIDSIMLNEACSSGCGSFIQTFAETLGMNAHEFSLEAVSARNPVDLGTRCTVFMNSRVKQAQKEGATVGDISAGLAYAVVRNALYKVIKIRDTEQLGKNIVVLGGTFLNDAILRGFERITGRDVVRPSIAGLMGALGAALIARERYDGKTATTLAGPERLDAFEMKTRRAVCGLCGNNCRLTIAQFDNGQRYVSGNRCERGAGVTRKTGLLPNLFQYKYERLFSYPEKSDDEAPRGTIGMPRVLNIYENYPFWYTFFDELGFRVVLSSRSSHALYEKGMETIPSESVCYPAKLAHGHVTELVEMGVRRIFYPDLPRERNENPDANNHYNCPIVTSYPEVLRANMDVLRDPDVTFLNPFLPFDRPRALADRLTEVLAPYGVKRAEVQKAVTSGFLELDRFHRDIRDKGAETIRMLEETGQHGVVLAGRPYHLDPEIHHGIPDMINGLGLAVLTEESVAGYRELKRPIRVVDQWMYHSRLYEAAAYVAKTPFLELVQLNSFGCGLDAVTSEQVQEILESAGRMYTLLKIDEISNLGAARIRMRSLKVAMQERAGNLAVREEAETYRMTRIPFTRRMKKKHTLIGPQMSPVHFELISAVLNRFGYRTEILENVQESDVETGLKYVNNDACYPTILVVGQLVNAFLEGRYDPDNSSVLITQTGGACRATNYVAFLRKAMKEAGFPQVPIISLSVQGIETNPGFRMTPRLAAAAIRAVVLGDLLQTVLLRVRPYERVKGSANQLYRFWMKQCRQFLSGTGGRSLKYRDLIHRVVDAFSRFDFDQSIRKPMVGVVGEILVKFHPDANNNVIGVIESEQCEARMPGLLDFFLYSFRNGIWQVQNMGAARKVAWMAHLAIFGLERMRRHMRNALQQSGLFAVPERIGQLAERASEVLSLGNASGEGWFLTAEMLELIHSGAPNIICAQPFACLPNHVTGKGMIREIRRLYPGANIVPVDYDPGASEVNQINRIKLMIATAIRQHGFHAGAHAEEPADTV